MSNRETATEYFVINNSRTEFGRTKFLKMRERERVANWFIVFVKVQKVSKQKAKNC